MRVITTRYDKQLSIRQNFKILSKELKQIPQDTNKFNEEDVFDVERFIKTFLSELEDVKVYNDYVISKPMTVIFNHSSKNNISISLKSATRQTDDGGRIVSTISSKNDVMLEDYIEEDYIEEETAKQNEIQSQNYTLEQQKMEQMHTILADHNMSFGTLKDLLALYTRHSISRIPNSILNKYYPEQIV